MFYREAVSFNLTDPIISLNSPDCVELSSKFGGTLKWVNSCRYLGIYFVSGRTSIKCAFCNAKSHFFRAFNAVYGKVGRAASDECVLVLLQTKRLPVLFNMERKHAAALATGGLLNSL